MVKLNRSLLMFSCLIILISAGSWGFLVHRTVSQLAIYKLPKKMQPFFYENMDYLIRHSVRPDLRRNEDKTEAPKHFIDLEAYGDSAEWKMPYSWSEAVRKFSRDTLEKYGYVPYWIMVMKERLTNAFRTGNKDSILFYAADVAHYIGDAHVPLHTTLNYDGQLTNQKGLHSLWESTIPEIEFDQYQLYSRHNAKYLAEPDEAIWRTIRNAYSLLENLFEQERQASKQFTDSTKYRVQKRNGRDVKSFTSSFAKAYSQRLGNTINQQLLRSAEFISDFWFTCWADAGKPDLEKIATSFSKEEKKKLKKELKAYRKNQLLQNRLLIARQNAETGGD